MQEKARAGKRPHVVVIGGGFAGLTAVRKLKDADVDITLIDRHTYNTFQPLLYQVATAALNPGDITWFLRAIRAKQDNVRFVRGTVLYMNHDQREIVLDGNVVVMYDYLIIATGVTANFFGISGAREHSMPLYRRSQALKLRDKIFAEFEDSAMNDHDRDLRIVVVGAGPTGVETAGALAEMRNNDLPVTYPELDSSRIEITLVEMGPAVLGPFDESLREYSAEALRERGVNLRLGTAVKEVTEKGVVVEHEGEQTFLETPIVIWASGVTAHSSISKWGLPQGRGGRIEVDGHQRVRGLPNVFAVGDVSINPDAALPQLAQPAIQGGQHVAAVISAAVSGQPAPKPFSYTDKGTMATIGRAAAIAEIKGLPTKNPIRVKGLPAWVIWVVVHIQQLLSNRNRFATMTNLSLKYLLWHSHNAIVGETPYIAARRPKIIDPNPD
ncbi:NAD(P)/FAD-dependent oxidoreductase [Ancrocorticia populi]|uniref:NADH:ubiquinone reductase (non-electrogenic) n=1 Tax=Ancrocorticia populi TaxID=2175228 RepID=A0A2V1KCW3_9ACTO|nr:NAD(P)/FAD-dependent oxidoreductase [Ancrocorticia populi]PWF27357.1 NADH dehydrogenase FAD-containing subunit [Ancrocorticia populi]